MKELVFKFSQYSNKCREIPHWQILHGFKVFTLVWKCWFCLSYYRSGGHLRVWLVWELSAAWTLDTSEEPRIPKTHQETKPYSGLGQLLSMLNRKKSFNQRHNKWLLASLNSKCCLWGQSYKLPKSNDSLGNLYNRCTNNSKWAQQLHQSCTVDPTPILLTLWLKERENISNLSESEK